MDGSVNKYEDVSLVNTFLNKSHKYIFALYYFLLKAIL